MALFSTTGGTKKKKSSQLSSISSTLPEGLTFNQPTGTTKIAAPKLTPTEGAGATTTLTGGGAVPVTSPLLRSPSAPILQGGDLTTAKDPAKVAAAEGVPTTDSTKQTTTFGPEQPSTAVPITAATVAAPASAATQQLLAESQRLQAGDVAGAQALGAPIPQVNQQQLNQQQQQLAAQQAATATIGGQPEATTQQDQLTAIRAQLTASMQPTADEISLTDELTNLRESARLGVSGLEGQGRGIPLSLVRGQQAQLTEQAAIQEQTLIDRLTNLQAQRTTQTQIALTQMGFAEQDIERVVQQQQQETETQVGMLKAGYIPVTDASKIPADAQLIQLGDQAFYAPREQAEPVTLNPGQSLVDPTTGQVIITADEKPLSVSPGSTVIDPATGEVVFQAPLTATNAVREYEFAVGQGYSGTFEEFVGSSGSDVKDLSSDASKLVANAQSGIAAIETMRKTVDENLGRGIFGLLTNRAYKTAQTNLVDIIGRIRSGGAITDDEVKSFQKLLPSSFDSDELARQKLTDIESLLNDVLTNIGVKSGGDDSDPLGLDFNQDLSTSVNGSGMRTDRHNNPTAFTSDIAKQAGLVEGTDFEVGDKFPEGNLTTANLLKDPIQTTIKVIDAIGFFTGGGAQRWSHTAMSESEWTKLSFNEKKDVIEQMYQREGGSALNSLFA